MLHALEHPSMPIGGRDLHFEFQVERLFEYFVSRTSVVFVNSGRGSQGYPIHADPVAVSK